MKIKGLYNMPGSKYFWYRWTQDGKRHAVSLKTDDLAEAIQKVKEIRAGAFFARWERATPVATPMTKVVEDYLTAAQKRAKKPMRPGTAERQGAILTKFLKDAEVESLAQLTLKKIHDWLSGIRKANRSADTLHTYARALHTFVAYLVKSKSARDDILDDFHIPDRGAVGRKNWLKKEEAQRVIVEACKLEDKTLAFVLFCGFHAGLRRNEIVNAKVNWFDLDTGLLHVQNDPASGFVLKDRENRSVPLTDGFKAFLLGLLKDRKQEEYVIHPSKKQGIWRYRYEFNGSFQSHMKRCRVTCSIHDMRRSFASNLVSQGESIYIVAKWLGDGVQVVERSYGHLAPSAGNINRLA